MNTVKYQYGYLIWYKEVRPNRPPADVVYFHEYDINGKKRKTGHQSLQEALQHLSILGWKICCRYKSSGMIYYDLQRIVEG